VDSDAYLIDLLYGGEEEVGGAYLLVDQHPTLVETGPTATLRRLIAGVEAAGLSMEDVHYVALTHIHLDHAGGVGALAERYPHLKVFVHPVGAPHLIDPSRLARSARRVFGERFDTLFGELKPVPSHQVHVLQDGEELVLGRGRLVAVNTPGHASHHYCFFDPDRRWMFTGDVAGVRLPGAGYIHPPTPPPDIHLEAWQASLDAIRRHQPARLMYTHFGWTDEPGPCLDEVEQRLVDWGQMVRESLDQGLEVPEIIQAFYQKFDRPLEEQLAPELVRRYRLTADATMNVEGLVRYWRKRLGI